MKSVLFAVILCFVLLLLFVPMQAQISFFQPPTFSGSGDMSVADFNGDGNPDILTSDGTLNLGNGDGTFKLGTPVPSGVLTVADFNGDGKPDILEQGTGTLLVLLGNGDGTFQSPISTASGANLSVVAATDLNGDGKADVVGVFNSSLIVYISNGDGTFKAGVSYNMGAASAGNTLLSFGDFNGDSRTDVAVSTGGNQVAGQEIVFLGNGDGTFQRIPKLSAGISDPSYLAAVGDFNGDGKFDLAISNVCCGGNAYILLGNGNGTFQSPAVAFPGAGPLVAVDVNKDGKLDLVLCIAYPFNTSPAIQIYLGNGDGTFSNSSNYVPSITESQNFAVAVGDFNLDGNADISAGNGVLLGNGDGTFQGIPLLLVPPPVSGYVTGDFEKSGAPDVAAISFYRGISTVYIFHNNGRAVFSLIHTYTVEQFGSGIVTADFNGDGNLDLVVMHSWGGEASDDFGYSVLLGNGDGSFQLPLEYPDVGSGWPNPVVAADFNNDNRTDLAFLAPFVSGGSGDYLRILRGNGDGSFAVSYVHNYLDNGFYSLLLGDFNGDGNLDLASPGVWQSQLETGILFGNGDGTFQLATFPPSLSGFVARIAADLNNDGKADLIGSSQVALGNGDGTFTVLPAMFGFHITALGDFNADGNLDALFYQPGSSTQTGVLPGNGDGTFGAPVYISVPTPTPYLPVAVDMNGDGLPDIIWNRGSEGVAVLLNTTQKASPQPDFRASASEFSPTPVIAGSSATATITITPVNGFTGSVAFSCSGLPSGVSCSFSPALVSGGSGSSTLTVSTDSSLAGGRYSIIVTGVSGSISHIAAKTLTVEGAEGADFQISAKWDSPATVTVGSLAIATITITPVNGFKGSVALSCGGFGDTTGYPTCSFNPAAVSGVSGSSTLTVNTTASVALGGYGFGVIGSSGSLSHSVHLELTVLAPPPDFTIGAISGKPTSQTISAGQSAKFSLVVTPLGGFTGAVNLTCGITPMVTPAPTCSLSSSSMSLSGSESQPLTVKIGTTASVTTSAVPSVGPPGAMPLAWTVMLLGSGLFLLRTRKRLTALATPAVVLAAASWVSCGGSGSPSTHTIPGTPARTYTATVTATSGSLSHNMALTAVVK